MAGQQGFAYESRVHNKLKSGGYVPAGFSPAGSNPSAPDAMFMYGGTTHKLEVKLNMAADYGQGTLNYSQGVWTLGGAKKVEKKDTRLVVTAADKKANTKAYQNYKAGNKAYKAADHLGEGKKADKDLSLIHI